MKKFIYMLFLSMFVVFLNITYCPIVDAAGYYDNVDDSTGIKLITSLSSIINSNTVDVGYSGLWTAYAKTDCKPNSNIIWDMYSNEEYECGGSKQGASYSKEGDSYNREHVVPQSWFSEKSPMKADLFHVYPTDGYVNNRRSNYLHGETKSPTYTSKNGSKLGPSSFSGYSGTVFEPIDEYKGDFARTYFYMATRYYSQVGKWTTGEAQNVFTGSYPYLTTYAINLFTKWNALDPVSEKETLRNDAVYSIQKNRNPFIDHPEYIDRIWPSEYTSNQAKIDDVITSINNIPTIVNIETKSLVNLAKTKYNALSDSEALQVTNKTKLDQAIILVNLFDNSFFIKETTKASLYVKYDTKTLNATNVKLRFGNLITMDSYIVDAKYGVLITSDKNAILEECIVPNTSLAEFLNKNRSYKAKTINPVRVSKLDSGKTVEDSLGNYYQFAWVITDMEEHYNNMLYAVTYMEYNNNLYLCDSKNYSVTSLAKYYYDNRVELGLSENEALVMKNLFSNGMIGGTLPGDVEKDFWS